MRHVNETMVQELIKKASKDERKRAFHLFHDDEEPLNRMLIAGVRGSYAAPHRHTLKLEFFTPVQGDLLVLEFNEAGDITNVYDLAACPYVEVQPMTWHSVLFMSDSWAFMEMALWPTAYDPDDKEFAPWAPLEGDPEVAEYSNKLMQKARAVLDAAA